MPALILQRTKDNNKSRNIVIVLLYTFEIQLKNSEHIPLDLLVILSLMEENYVQLSL